MSGVSDGEITLWRRGSNAAALQALAALTLDRDGSQLSRAENSSAAGSRPRARRCSSPTGCTGSAPASNTARHLLGIPEAQGQEEEEPFRRLGPGGRELDPVEENLLDRFNEAIRELRQIDPSNREATYVTGPNYVPNEATVRRIESALRDARINAVIAEATNAKGDVQSQIQLTESEAIDAGLKFVGPGYREIGKPGRWVFRSADGSRQFRIDDSSLEGRHKPFVPHISFETIDPITGKAVANNHVVITPDVSSK